MAYLVIPKEVTGKTANIWVAAVNQEFDRADSFLRYGAGGAGAEAEVHLDNAWLLYRTSSGRNFIYYQHVRLENLQPGTEYHVKFTGAEKEEGGAVKARGRLWTLPSELPSIDQRPFKRAGRFVFCSRARRQRPARAGIFKSPAV